MRDMTAELLPMNQLVSWKLNILCGFELRGEEAATNEKIRNLVIMDMIFIHMVLKYMALMDSSRRRFHSENLKEY